MSRWLTVVFATTLLLPTASVHAQKKAPDATEVADYKPFAR